MDVITMIRKFIETLISFPKPAFSPNQGGLLDTVGAVCVDSSGYIASAVSSGGLLLKHTGRVGQAAVYGCGCWAENNCDGMHELLCCLEGIWRLNSFPSHSIKHLFILCTIYFC